MKASSIASSATFYDKPSISNLPTLTRILALQGGEEVSF